MLKILVRFVVCSPVCFGQDSVRLIAWSLVLIDKDFSEFSILKPKISLGNNLYQKELFGLTQFVG